MQYETGLGLSVKDGIMPTYFKPKFKDGIMPTYFLSIRIHPDPTNRK